MLLYRWECCTCGQKSQKTAGGVLSAPFPLLKAILQRKEWSLFTPSSPTQPKPYKTSSHAYLWFVQLVSTVLSSLLWATCSKMVAVLPLVEMCTKPDILPWKPDSQQAPAGQLEWRTADGGSTREGTMQEPSSAASSPFCSWAFGRMCCIIQVLHWNPVLPLPVPSGCCTGAKCLFFFPSAAYEIFEHVSSPPWTKGCLHAHCAQPSANGVGENLKVLPSPPSLGTSSLLTEVHVLRT